MTLLRLVHNSLRSRLIITGVLLLVLVAIASIALIYNAQKYSFHLERSNRAQLVYTSYRAVSDHTYRKLSAMGETVEQGTLSNLEERYRNQEALRQALKNVRENIAAELSHVGDAKEADELEHLNKIELLAEEIIRGSASVRSALENGETAAARDALAKLRSDKIEGTFNRLIDEALVEENREVVQTQLVVQDLNSVLTRLLSFIFLFFVLACAFLLITTWRSLMRNLSAFEVAAKAYQGGDFSHKVPDNVETEFSGLAEALNQMSSEVESQRLQEKNTQGNLENIIENRTRELTDSNKKLEEVSETRKQFLADISHELRTPLTIMQGEADFALRGEIKTSDQYIDALRRVKEQTVHTTRLVQDLLFVARTEDGKAPVNKRTVSIVPLVSDICDDFDIIAAEKDIHIAQNHLVVDLAVNADAGRIKQVMTILLDNALRYSYANSTIEVTTRAQDQHVLIEVADSGIGLKSHEADQVFSRFYRGGGGANKASGTGLGLPVAKAIIDAHNGHISLQGVEGSGTTATVSLPVEPLLRAVQ